MSIQNLISANNKAWLNAKFGTMNSTRINVLAGDEIDISSAGILNVGGSAGVVGDILRKNSSGNLEWASARFGEGFQDQENLTGGGFFATNSLTLVPVPGTDFAPTGIIAGDYMLRFSCEMQNTTGGIEIRVFDTTSGSVQLFNFAIPGLQTITNAMSYKIMTLPAGTNTFEVQLRAIGAPIADIREVRWMLYRVD